MNFSHAVWAQKKNAEFLTAEKLTKAFADNEDTARKKYAGLAPLVVEGTVLNLEKLKSGNLYVHLKGHADTWKVTCDFEAKDAKAILDSVKPNQKISVAGAGYGPVIQREVLIAFCKIVPSGGPAIDPKSKVKPDPISPTTKKPSYKPAKGLIEIAQTKTSWKAVELTENLEYLTNRGYAIEKMPKEMAGAHVLVHSNMEGGWLKPGHFTMAKDGFLYVALWTKAYGETRVRAEQLSAFEEDGWTLLKEPFETSFPPGEDWQWRALRKPVTKGQSEFPWPSALPYIDTQYIFAFGPRKE
ncbi:MAG: OB-fold putative lipoprotein [Gemmataceae bacterium]|nr:OB-fold putative lipoprotein [Gemmataceae bacterium]MCI0738139.1 OB-fold putative lipoprotein [Gemmataceae bacterium]